MKGRQAAACAAILVMAALPAKADIITEFGAVWKVNSTTSYLAQPDCHTATVVEPADNPRLKGIWSCGGDNPMFIGWPVAWEKEFSGPWTVRAGWSHVSHWFDGGPDREIHIDAVGVTVKFNWSKRRDKD